MRKESKSNPQDLKDLALITIEDSVSAFYQAQKRGFLSEQESKLLNRDVEVGLAIARSAKVEAYDIATAVLSATPSELRGSVLHNLVTTYPLANDEIETLKTIFEIK